MTQGVSYLDATVDGMGRGAGNCALELLLGFLKNPKYQVAPILKIIEEYTHKFKAEGVKWGYDIPYLLTGQYNTHPRPAIQFVKRTDRIITSSQMNFMILSTAKNNSPLQNNKNEENHYGI